MQSIAITNWSDCVSHTLSVYPNEMCGFVIDNKFVPASNVSENPQLTFCIATSEYIEAQHLNVQAIIHSHTYGAHNAHNKRYDERTPSEDDVRSQLATSIPWAIVSTEGENVTSPIWFGFDQPDPLEGRPYIANVYDCYTLVRDYYHAHKIKLGVYPRPIEWEQADKRIYEHNWQQERFEKIALKDLKPGDLIYFNIGTSYVNHAGVYLGDNKLLHHLYNRLSGIDSFSRWSRFITYALRHPDFE